MAIGCCSCISNLQFLLCKKAHVNAGLADAFAIIAGLKMVCKNFGVEKVPTLISVYGGSILDVRDGAIEDEALQVYLANITKATSV